MYINVGGYPELLNNGTEEAVLMVDSYTPKEIIWVTKVKGKLAVIAHPTNQKAAQQLVDIHNQIWDSPLAKVMREEE